MENDDRRNGPILTKVESTQIFGNIEEIYHLHLNITEQLDRAINEDNCIGSVFLDNVSHLLENIRDAYRSTLGRKRGFAFPLQVHLAQIKLVGSKNSALGPGLLNVFHFGELQYNEPSLYGNFL